MKRNTTKYGIWSKTLEYLDGISVKHTVGGSMPTLTQIKAAKVANILRQILSAAEARVSGHVELSGFLKTFFEESAVMVKIVADGVKALSDNVLKARIIGGKIFLVPA